MRRIAESISIEASLAEVWDYYFDPRGWPAWVDGFGSVQGAEAYPEREGSLRWRSIAAGRGEVEERVLEHEPRRVHRIAFTDPSTTGELRTTFTIEGSGTRVGQELEYRLKRGGPFARVADRLFIRSQMRASVRRSLSRLKLEVEEVAQISP
jgi:uncharacterized membrane protein